MKIYLINKIVGFLLILLTIAIAIPLTIKTIDSDGGTWGFGMVGISILLPLCCYILFAVAGMLNKESAQRKVFIAAHVISVSVGLLGFFIFPLYPKVIVLIPLALAILGIRDEKRTVYYLLLMMVLGIIANLLLLKWEIDFGRTVPLIEFLYPA